MKLSAEEALKSFLEFKSKQPKSKKKGYEKRNLDEETLNKLETVDKNKILELKEKAKQKFDKEVAGFNKLRISSQGKSHKTQNNQFTGEVIITQDDCFSSAITCLGDSCTLNPAEVFPSVHSSEAGGVFGIDVAEWTTDTHTLYYIFYPNNNGTLTVTAEISVSGFVQVVTGDLYYLYTLFPFIEFRNFAQATAELEIAIWQGNIQLPQNEDNPNVNNVVVGNVYCGDSCSNEQSFYSQIFNLTTNAIVEQDMWVVIEVNATVGAIGVSYAAQSFSNFIWSDGDDFKGGFVVNELCADLVTPVVNPL